MPGLNSRLGFAGGVLLNALQQLDPASLLNSLIYGFVGAVASYLATLLCRYCVQRLREYLKRRKR